MGKEIDLSKEGYIKKSGYWVSKKFRDAIDPIKPMFCKKCGVVTHHKDDRYLIAYEMCGNCYFDKEMNMLSSGSLKDEEVGKLKGIK